jgi:hypothetical protein
MLIAITCRERRPIGLRISTDAAAQLPRGKDEKIMQAAAEEPTAARILGQASGP